MGTSSIEKQQEKRRDAFGQGLGIGHEFGLAMGDEHVTPTMLKFAASDPLRKKSVGAALRGELTFAKADFDFILTREQENITTIFNFAGIKQPETDMIVRALRSAEERFGVITTHDRVIPASLTLDILFRALYGFNAWATNQDGYQPIKLEHNQNGEWWGTDRDVKHLPTELGVLRLDFAEAMQATDLIGRPYNLNMDDQNAWALEQGGSGLYSAEQTIYVFLRSIIERNRLLWSVGSCRCRNAYGSGRSLRVRFDAGDGFCVDYWDCDVRRWSLGALPEVSVLVP